MDLCREDPRKDLFVPEETEVEYMIIPVKGTPGKKLIEIPEHKVRTNAVKATDSLGAQRVVFNRVMTAKKIKESQ